MLSQPPTAKKVGGGLFGLHPIADGDSESAAEHQLLTVPIDPIGQPRPLAKQSLMGNLDGRSPRDFVAIEHDEPVLREPIPLAGTLVERASLHNPTIIAALDVRIGDAVVVTKRNEIIPQIVEVILSKRPTGASPYEPATTCPSCGEDLDFSAARPKCLSPSCSLQSRLASAASRNGFDWDGVGKIALGKAVNAAVVAAAVSIVLLDFFLTYLLP